MKWKFGDVLKFSHPIEWYAMFIASDRKNGYWLVTLQDDHHGITTMSTMYKKGQPFRWNVLAGKPWEKVP